MKGCPSAESRRKAGGPEALGLQSCCAILAWMEKSFKQTLLMGQLNPRTLHYIHRNTFWDVRPSYHTSNILRLILSIRDVLKRYIRSIIGDCSNTNVWSDIGRGKLDQSIRRESDLPTILAHPKPETSKWKMWHRKSFDEYYFEENEAERSLFLWAGHNSKQNEMLHSRQHRKRSRSNGSLPMK
ncbi:hypothetical protein V6N11_034303 [Hibiscus sabdariffa]|uniref:Uncharacterized protein n=2 Tax=Hibiscus sabdariffa TaxID=183260 RepID=A0ABR2BEF9_9ROSI